MFFLVIANCYCQNVCTSITLSLQDRQDLLYKERPCTYFKDINGTFNKFLGTWIYNQDGHYFRITFFKTENVDYWFSDRQTEDIVESHYEYKYNGNLIFENYSTNRTMVSSNILYNDNFLGFSYLEPSLTSCNKARIGRLKITYSLNSSGLPILIWERVIVPLTQNPFPCPDNSAPDESDFLVPANMVLTKQ